MDDMVIVSDGNEIAYAKTILDLFKMQLNEEMVVRSSLGEKHNVELYSKAAFAHTSISSKVEKVYVGLMNPDKKQWEPVYNKYGMHIDKNENCFRVYVDSKLVDENYKLLFSELQGLEKAFFEKESEYITAIEMKKSEFVEKNKTVLFSKRIEKERNIQAYRCLSYHLYFDYLFVDASEKSLEM